MISSIKGSAAINVYSANDTIPYVSPSTDNPIQGVMRLNVDKLEVFDRGIWRPWRLDSVTIELNDVTRELLEWCQRQRERQSKLDALMQQHPGLQDLHDKFEMMRVLCEKEADR